MFEKRYVVCTSFLKRFITSKGKLRQDENKKKTNEEATIPLLTVTKFVTQFAFFVFAILLKGLYHYLRLK